MALVTVLSTPVMAAFKTIAELDSYIGDHGCRQKLVPDEDRATLLTTCAVDKVTIDKNLRATFFAGDITDSYFRNHANLMTCLFLRDITAEALLLYYSTSDIDQLAVMGRIMGRDIYGHPIDEIRFTYGFDREIYRKIDPIHIKRKDISKVAKNHQPSGIDCEE